MPLILSFLLASAPTSQVLADGSVQASIHVDLAPELVWPQMDSPSKIAALSQAGGIESEVKEGECWLLHRKMDLVVYTIDWHTKACPTTSGLMETLVEGEGMKSYQSLWQVLPDGEGSLIQIQSKTLTSLPAPPGMVQKAAIKESEAGLRNIKAALEAN